MIRFSSRFRFANNSGVRIADPERSRDPSGFSGTVNLGGSGATPTARDPRRQAS